MLISLSLIVFGGFAASGIMKKCKLPPLLGMILTGVLLGPYVLDLIDPAILAISTDLRQIALIVILIRAGLALDIPDIRQVGRPAVLMSFIPATFELVGVVLLGPMLLGISVLEAAIMGAVLAAVSPAVVVPRMLRLMEEGYGQDKKIPQLILAGASVDDIFVIVLFTSFIQMYQGEGFHAATLLRVPVAVITGLFAGFITGMIAVWFYRKYHVRDTVKVLLLLGVSFLLTSLDGALPDFLPLSGLLAVMGLGSTILFRHKELAKRLSTKYSKMWVAAELLLFVLIGAAVDIRYIGNAGVRAVTLIVLSLILRIAGVYFCLVKTNLNQKERLFTAISYLPKATVQAAIGGIPLSLGLPAGNLILTVAVLAIVISAPVGAIGIDTSYKKLLTCSKV